MYKRKDLFMKQKNQQNRVQKNRTCIKWKTTAVAVSAVMTLGCATPAFAAAEKSSKDENVYVTLNEDGSVENVYVVNEFTSDQAGTITDYGAYDSVKNLTTDDAIAQKGDQITVSAPEGKFYYQGNLKSTDIPWEISIRYFLDGSEISAENLAGKSGKLKIQLAITENKACKGNFFENYLLQTTVLLDTEKCTKIIADGATAANVGKNRQLLYNLMAGQEKTIEITADVTDFEMDGITFQGVPMSFDLDTDSLDTAELKDKTKEIQDAAAELKDGAGELSDGTRRAADGSEALADGTKKLSDGVNTLSDGGYELLEGSRSLYAGASTLQQGIKSYTAGTKELSDGIDAYLAGTEQLKSGAEQLRALSGLDQIHTAVQTMEKKVGTDVSQSQTLLGGSAALTAGLGQLKEQMNQFAGSASYEKLAATLEKVQTLQQSLQTISGQMTQMSSLLVLSAEQAQNMAMESQSAAAKVQEQVQQASTEITAENQQNQAAAAEVNASADQAAQAIDNSVAAGAIDEETASSLKAALASAKCSVADTTAVSEITAPEETAAMQEQAAFFAQAAEQMKQGAAGLSRAAEQISESASSVEVPEDLDTVLSRLTGAVAMAYEGAEALQNGIGQLGSGLTELDEQTESLPQAAEGVTRLIDGINELTGKNSTLQKGAESLVSTSGTLNSGAARLTDGIAKSSQGTESAVSGLEILQSGAAALISGAGDLNDGLLTLSDGAEEMRSGTQEFYTQTSEIDTKIEDEVKEVMKKFTSDDYEVESFTSEKNTRIGLVQFAIRTDDIKKQEAEEKEETTEKTTIWEKIAGLFRRGE